MLYFLLATWPPIYFDLVANNSTMMTRVRMENPKAFRLVPILDGFEIHKLEVIVKIDLGVNSVLICIVTPRY